MNFKRDNAWIFRQMSQFPISLVFVIMLNLGPLQVKASLDRLIGCFKDDYDRVLDGNRTELNPNGRNECKQYCQDYRYFGTESGEECFCGNEIRYKINASICGHKCEGNSAEICGGHWEIMIYDTQSYENTSTTPSTEISVSKHHVTETSKRTSPQSSVNHVTETSKRTSPQSSVNPMIETRRSTSQKPTTNHDTLSTLKPVRKMHTAAPLSLIGCFEDSSNRVLNGKTTKLNPNGNKQCNQYCQGYLYFGTESGDECFCGDEIRFHKKTAPCTDICRGNPGEYCGGHLHIMIYGTQSHENTSTPSSRQISVSGHPVTEKSRSTSQKPSTNHDTLSTLKPVRKTDTGDDKSPVFYLYILLPVGIIVIAVILVIIFCKRRLRCKKDSDPVAFNSVVYAAPYSTAYHTPVHEAELEHTSEMRSGNVNDANIGNDVYDRAGNFTEESEDYNVINLRSNNKTVHNDSYDTLQEYNACLPGDSNTIYNKLKLFNSGNQNKSELLYDQTDKGSLESKAKRHSVHNDTELVQGVDEDKKTNVKDNIYANEDGHSN